MSTLKYRYKIPPSSAETAYRTTMVLAYEADWTARNRRLRRPRRQRLVSDCAEQRDRDQTMSDQKCGRH